MIKATSALTIHGVVATQRTTRRRTTLPPPRRIGMITLKHVRPTAHIVGITTSSANEVRHLRITGKSIIRPKRVLTCLSHCTIHQTRQSCVTDRLTRTRTRLTTRAGLNTTRTRRTDAHLTRVSKPRRTTVTTRTTTMQDLRTRLKITRVSLTQFRRLGATKTLSHRRLSHRRTAIGHLQTSLTGTRSARRQLRRTELASLRGTRTREISIRTAADQTRIRDQIGSTTRGLTLTRTRLTLALMQTPDTKRILSVFACPNRTIPRSNRPVLTLNSADRVCIITRICRASVNLMGIKRPTAVADHGKTFDRALANAIRRVNLRVTGGSILSSSPTTGTSTQIMRIQIQVSRDRTITTLAGLRISITVSIS